MIHQWEVDFNIVFFNAVHKIQMLLKMVLRLVVLLQNVIKTQIVIKKIKSGKIWSL